MASEPSQRDRLERVEMAIAEVAYLAHGERGFSTLQRFCPNAAALVRAWFDSTEPASDVFGAPRRSRETAVASTAGREER